MWKRSQSINCCSTFKKLGPRGAQHPQDLVPRAGSARFGANGLGHLGLGRLRRPLGMGPKVGPQGPRRLRRHKTKGPWGVQLGHGGPSGPAWANGPFCPPWGPGGPSGPAWQKWPSPPPPESETDPLQKTLFGNRKCIVLGMFRHWRVEVCDPCIMDPIYV